MKIPRFLKVKGLKRGRLSSQKGAFLVTAALMTTPLLGVAALSTDIGMAFLVRTEMSNGADLASLAAIKSFAGGEGELDEERLQQIRQAAEITGQLNSTRNNHSIDIDTSPVTGNVEEADIVFGFYDHDGKDFTAYTDSEVMAGNKIVNAIRTRVTLGDGENEPFTFRFARFLKNYSENFSNLVMVSESIATFGLMNILPVFDISASMDNNSYQPVEACQYSELPFTADRWFHYAARPEKEGQCENNHDKLVIGPVSGDYEVVMPQPITSVFETTRDVLLEKNQLFKGLYRGGLMVYETTAYAPYSPSSQSVELTATSHSNKEKIKEVINFAIDQWKTWAANGPYNRYAGKDYESLSKAYPNLPFPGGLNPPETTYTNTGDAIFKAVSWIMNANEATKTQSTDVIILFSDGLPNCYRIPYNDPLKADFSVPPECPRIGDLRNQVEAYMDYYKKIFEPIKNLLPPGYIEALMNALQNYFLDYFKNEYDALGQQWSLANADFAAEFNIQIHSIYYGTDDEGGGCSKDSPSPAYAHLKEVSNRTGGHAYCAENIDQLAEIFNELSTRQSFVLVSPDPDAGSSDDTGKDDSTSRD